MWLKEKMLNGERCIFLRPEKVEYIRIEDYPRGQGEGGTFSIGIDGVKYASCQKFNFPPATGICFLYSPDRNQYYCDDAIIIAALTRFWLTYFIKIRDEWPEQGYELPLLSRVESRQYLKWHRIPHPGTDY